MPRRSGPLLTPAAALIAAALSVASCASPAAVRRPAHGTFPRESRGEVWKRLLHVIESQGYAVLLDDEARGIIATRERELERPCGGGTCLARQALRVRLTGDGQVTLAVFRENWDPDGRRWAQASDRASVASVEQDQLALLAEVVPQAALRDSM